MRKLKELWPKGLAGKLIRFVVIFVLVMGVVFLTMSYIQLALLKKSTRIADEKQTDMVQGEYKFSMAMFSAEYLSRLIVWVSDKTDDEFWILDHDIRTLQTQVEDVFLYPENYERLKVSPPQIENEGKFALQILYPDGEEKVSPDTIEMM